MTTFKIPSLDLLVDGAKRVLLRFPLTITCALGLATCIIVGLNHEKEIRLIVKLGMVSGLGISLFTALHLWLERRNALPPQKTGILLAFVALLGVYAWLLPEEMSWTDGSRFSVFVAVSHLLVSFLPFYNTKEHNGFWQFNLVLFGRVCTTILYSLVLSTAILGAIGAVQLLFSININPKLYFYISVFINVILSTFIFLADIPDDYETLELYGGYPEGLKFFAQYALIPIIIMYGVILYAYGFMILFNWSLPKGMVIGLLIGLTITSIFAMLLVHPIRDRAGSQWVKWFGKGFYIAILPLMLLYFVAIGRRIYEYGLTENRYFVLVAGLWLVGMAIYFILSSEKLIIYIPITLAVVGMASVVGPWSAYSVGVYSQVARLGTILARNGMLENGKIDKSQKRGKSISEKDAQEIRSIVYYLAYQERTDALQTYFKEDLSEKKAKEKNEEESRILALMGNDEMQKKLQKNEYISSRSYYSKDDKEWQKVEGYQYMIPLRFSGYKNAAENVKTFEIDNMSLEIEIQGQQNKLIIRNKRKEICTINLNSTLENLIKQEETQIASSDLTVVAEGAKYKVLCKINELSTHKSAAKNQYEIQSFTANLLLKITE